MPLKCLTADNKAVLAYQLTRDDFESLRARQRAQHDLHFDCCDAQVGLRVSRKGIKHFYHVGGRGLCPYESESEAHLSLKYAVMLAAQKAGWTAGIEVSSDAGSAAAWRADVFAQRGNVKIAIEVQLATLAWDLIAARQARYRAASVRGLWLLGQNHYGVSRDIPAFHVRLHDHDGWQVRISPPDDRRHNVTPRKFSGHWVGLEAFVIAALSKDLVWAPALSLHSVDVILRTAPPVKCACGADLLLPTSLAVSLPCAGHRSLLWSVLEYEPHTPNAGPAWLNALVEVFNRDCEDGTGALFATRHRRGRALHYYLCPRCGAERDDVSTRRGERAITRRGLDWRVLPEAIEESAEFRFLNQWWVRA